MESLSDYLYYEETNPDIKLYCGDASDVLPLLEERSIDIVVTSPPYNVGIKYKGYNDNFNWDIYWFNSNEIIRLLYDKLKRGGRLCWNVQINIRRKDQAMRVNLMQKYKNLFETNDYLDMGDIIWIEKTLPKRTAWGSWLSPSCPYIQMPLECIMVYAKEIATLQNRGTTDLTKEEFMKWVIGVWEFNNLGSKEHPAVFPKKLVSRCIRLFSWKESIVLDPYMGSGTTLKVCKELGHPAIGIDISEHYCEVAKKMLKSTTRSML